MTDTILFLSANPQDTQRLNLDAEAREIREGLQRSQQRDAFKIETSPAASPSSMRRALLDHSPRIAHFAGHGEGEDGLVFDDGAGNRQLVETEALAKLFKLFATDIQCVLLNACYSEIQAEAIAQHIDYVIGMSQAIEDNAARAFAVAFYDALGAGRDIEFAYQSACVELEMLNLPQRPVLHRRSHAPVAAAKPVQTDALTVFLAEVPDDLSPQRKQVQIALEQQGARVLPENLYYFPDAAALQQQLDADLAQSRLFVQLLSATNPQRPPGMTTPLLQAQRARALNLPGVWWHPRDLDSSLADPDLQGLLQYAESSDLQNFLYNLQDRLRNLHKAKPEDAVEDLFVFLNLAPEDQTLLPELKKQLDTHNIAYSLPLALSDPNAAPGDLRADLEDNLCDCEAVVLFHCHASLAWLREQLRRCQRALGKRDEPLRVAMMCRCTEHAGTDLGMSLPKLKLRIVDCRPPLEESCLPRFFEALKGEKQ